MSPSKRLGGTIEPVTDHPAPTTEEVDAEPPARSDPSPNGNGARNGHAPGGGSAAVAVRKRRTTTMSAPAVPERGTSSSRGASSSVIAKPAATGGGAAPRLTERVRRLTDPIVASLAGDRSRHGVNDAATNAATETMSATPAASTTTSTDTIELPQTTGSWLETTRTAPDAAAAPATVDLARVDAPPAAAPQDRVAEPEAAPAVPAVAPSPAPAERGSDLVDLLDVPARPPVLPTAPRAVPPPPEPPYTAPSMSTHQVAPVPRVVGRRPRVRKVTRVVRHVDPWSVFKVAIVFNLVLYVVALTAGVLLWNVAYATGTIDNLERFFESFGWSDFQFNGGAIYHNGWIGGLFAVVGLTGAAILAATLFNLITDLVGGVRMTVLEEEVVERTASPMRRFVVRRPTAPMPEEPVAPPTDNLPARQESGADGSG